MDRDTDDKEEKGRENLVARSMTKKCPNRDIRIKGGRGGDSKALGIYSKATSLRCGWQSRSHENSKDV